MENFLIAKHINKTFTGTRVLTDVSFSIENGQVVALVGENGAGKSTIANIISGALMPDSGTLTICGCDYPSLSIKQAQEIGIAMVHQELMMLPELSIAANIFIGTEDKQYGFMKKKAMYNKSVEILKQIGISLNPNTLVKHIDVAACQMIEIARAISGNAKLIILDEPTSSLSQNEIKNLFSTICRLKEEGVAFLFVSHKLPEILEISDKIYVLRDGVLVKELDPRIATQDDIVLNMVGRTFKDFYNRKRTFFGDEVLRLENFSGVNNAARYRNKHCPQNISLKLFEGEVLGIAGLVGAGRTELIKLIFADNPKTHDSNMFLYKKHEEIRSCKDAIKKGLVWITEDRKTEGLILSFSILKNISLPLLDILKRIIFVSKSKENRISDQYIKKLNIKTTGRNQLTQYLSGGNQQKVVIAKWLAKTPKIIIMDEPTRGIDIGAKVEIYKLINELTSKGIAILLVSSELPEVMGISDRILVMNDGSVTGEFTRDEFSETAIMTCATGRSNQI